MSCQEEDYSFYVNNNYINEMQNKYPNLQFERIENTEGMYITNPENLSLRNDIRIFRETQLKRCGWIWATRSGQNKLQYFSKNESHDDIYQLDSPMNVQMDEKYAIQNVGHATQLILLPSCTILTDPIFGQLFWVIFPEKTESHPKINNLPRIDIVLISHNHRDHVDKNSLCKILAHHKDKGWPAPQVLVPMGDKKLFQGFGFKQVEEVEWFTNISIVKNGNSVRFISIPADHRSGRSGITDHHKSLVVGWVINDEKNDVILKYSGDTRSLSDENQKAVDAILWNEIKSKEANKDKEDKDVTIPDIICFEPSGPNYTRCDMDITHQSTSYSALLKFIEAENIAKLSGQNSLEILKKIQTVMIHHNKFELGPDRFNEGLFVLKKLIIYLGLNQEDLYKELEKQNFKLENDLDRKVILQNIPLLYRPLIWNLQKQTSMFKHAKNFIIDDILKVTEKLESFDNEHIKEFLIKYLKSNTKFLKIGERKNQGELSSLKFNIEPIEKYRS